MKVIHLPTATSGLSWNLAQGEKSLGLHSQVLCTFSHPFGYPCDVNLKLNEITSRVGRFYKLASTFFSIRDKYDIFHFNFGSSLLNLPALGLYQADLPFYAKQSRLFVTYYGCDARQKYETLKRTSISACSNPLCYDGVCNSGKNDKARRSSIAKMAKRVDHMWALNPDLLYFLPRKKASFLPYPVPEQNHLPGLPDFNKKRLRILHAPTDRAVKGTDHFLAAIDRLEKTHSQYFEVQLVENTLHQKALQLFQNADVIFDQLLVGWYGSFAVEAMNMGKPVIARIAEKDLQFIPKDMADDVAATVIHAEPQSIYRALRQCLEDREFLRHRAQASIEYARKWHAPAYVAGITRTAYESALPI